MRVFLKLSYNGTPFHGWQVQPNAVSVQGVLEDAISKIARQPIAITGAGRTDTGVNARTMIAHCDLPDALLSKPQPLADNLCSNDEQQVDTDEIINAECVEIDENLKAKFIRGVNSIVGRDIVLYDLWQVAPTAHARFDATARTYHYYVHHRRDPFLNFSLEIAPLDYEAMNSAASMLLNVSDFTSFAKLHSDAKTNICKVTQAEWVDLGDDRYVFIISADRFLRNMVRAVVGTLIEVGRHKLTLEQFEAVIERRDRCAAGTSMPPHPLFLWDVTY